MQYIGEYLLTTNSIGNEQDQLQKQFIFTPDMYDNPSSDLENIFVIKNSAYMPQRYDTLSENSGYVVDTIEINKKVTQDDGAADKFCSYVVTATYDLYENVRRRDSNGGGGGSNNDDVDSDGNPVDEDTAPWKIRATVNYQPVEVKIPFLKGLNDLETEYNVDVLNSAGQRLNVEATRYRKEITWIKAFESYQSEYSNINQPYVNSDNFNFAYVTDTSNYFTYPSGTLLLLPPSYSLQYWKHKLSKESKHYTYTKYYNYSFRMIYDPRGWRKRVLDVGTWAKFGSNTDPEQIYQETVVQNGTSTINYVNLATALQHRKQYDEQTNINYSYQAVTQDMPLTVSGTVYEAAIKNPAQNPYNIKSFKMYKSTSFTALFDGGI